MLPLSPSPRQDLDPDGVAVIQREAYPTPWQRKILWTALAALAVVTIGVIAIGIVWLISRVLAFLQPILIPFAVAGVLAYLLEPLVVRIIGWGTSRHRAVLAVFALVTIVFVGMLVWILPAISQQSVVLARKVPGYTERTKTRLVDFADQVREKYGVNIMPEWPQGETPAAGETTLHPIAPFGPVLPPDKTVADVPEAPRGLQELFSGDWLQSTVRSLTRNIWNVIRSSLGGFLGVLGFLLSMVIVPVYLYYLLIESPNIAESWQDYLPLRASAFKDEVVSVLSEINGYLIAFFRGQLVVSLINGTATGLLLMTAGLDFGLLLGLALCLLGLIPYLGIILTWIPAVIIASVQGGSWLIPGSGPWWLFPAVVTGILVIVQQIDGLFITPKIVGESVGLHPLTVIVSVFSWSLLMGGLLGAILAVPMTATLKVLLRRYIWERRFRGPGHRVATEETFALEQALERPGAPAMLH